jgi:hypothetical protein
MQKPKSGDEELPRGVRQRANGNFVVERVIDGKRRPKTVKTREEAIRLKNELNARRSGERGEEWPWMPPARIERRSPPQPLMPNGGMLQLENGAWAIIGKEGGVLTIEEGPSSQVAPAPTGRFTLGESFQVAFETPGGEGGLLGRKRGIAVTHADMLTSYFGARFPIEHIRRATNDDDPWTRTLDGLVDALRASQELDIRLDQRHSIGAILDTLRKALMLAVANKKLAALPEFPPIPNDDECCEMVFSAEEGCFRSIWQSLGLRADANFVVQFRARDAVNNAPSLEFAAVVALLRNVCDRLKRVEQAVALTKG